MFASSASPVLFPPSETKIIDTNRVHHQRESLPSSLTPSQIQRSMVDEVVQDLSLRKQVQHSAFRPIVASHLIPPMHGSVTEALVALSIAEMLLACQSTAAQLEFSSPMVCSPPACNLPHKCNSQRLYEEALNDLKKQSIHHVEHSLGIIDSAQLSPFLQILNQYLLQPSTSTDDRNDIRQQTMKTKVANYEQPQVAKLASGTLRNRRDSADKVLDQDERRSCLAKTESVQNQHHFECKRCKKSYTTVSGLLKHQTQHCKESLKRQYACQQCEKQYHSMCALKMHIRTHTLPCQCSICGKAFSRMWLLNGHIRTHTGEKPFNCDICQRAFADRSNLRAHMQTHCEEKRYKCETCFKTFSRMGLLTKHRCRIIHR